MILVQAQYCPQNHRCPTLRVCSTGALTQHGYSAPTIDVEVCTECGSCVASCRVFKQVADASPEQVGGQRNGRDGSSSSLLEKLSRRLHS